MRCFRCMKEFSEEYEVCPHCGYICNGKMPGGGYFLPEGTVLLNRYYIGIVLGCGGFGITYKAYDKVLDVIVAVKEYYPRGLVRRLDDSVTVDLCIKDDVDEFRIGMRRFLAEARTLARFSKHDNIVNVYNFYENNSTAYIVMEYLEGITLKTFLDNNDGIMSVDNCIYVIKSIAQALISLHREGILHRDVSPDNIFLCRDGRVKLIDFGAARLVGPAGNTGKVVVKVGYAPPEQYRENDEQGPWTDLYAVGASFYRALTGCTPVESLIRIKEDCLKSPKECFQDREEDIPDYLNNAIMKLLMLSPEDRFGSAEELLDVIDKKKTVSLVTAGKKRQKRQIRKKIIAVLLGLIPIIMLLFSWWYSNR